MAEPRLVFFGGKGGVGKTTCAAAAAVRAAAEGARVLVVSTDPAHSLGDALARRLGAAPRQVPLPVRTRGSLDAALLDADRALGRWLRDRDDALRTILDRGTYLDGEDVDRILSLSFPGVDELVGLVELARLAAARPYDVVVVDTAPTGHTLRLLETPETLARLGQVLDDMHDKHRFLASSLGGGWRPDFADAAIADITRQAEELRARLTAPTRASFTWVTLPEELPVRESTAALAALEKLGVAVPRVVVNRVWAEPDRPCPKCTPRVRAEAVWRARIRGSFGGAREVLEVPAQLVEPRGTEALLALAGSVRRAAKGPPSAAHPAKAAASRRHRAEPAALPIPATAKLVLVVGKGGVGKTTVAAATALDLAARRPRDRVLVLSTDPAHSLGDALDVALGDAETRLGENLVGRELDAAAAWAAERERYRRSIEDLFASIFRGRMDAAYDRAVLEDLLDLAPPGIDELLAVVTITDALALRSRGHPDGPDRGRHPEGARSAGRYDLVVVDTAPTGHTLRLLALPAMALDWVHAAMEILLKYREVVGLGELAGDLTAFARRLRALLALLADRGKTAFVAVARPAALPRLETARLARELGGLGVPLAAIVANAVSEPTCARCASAAEREEPELERLGAVARRYAASPHLVVAPATYPGPRGAAALERWRATWTQR